MPTPLPMSAAGNRFLVLDGFDDDLPGEPAEYVLELGKSTPTGWDGLLIVKPPTAGGDCRMVLFNRDGSQPEACGNGLRCSAKLVIERGHVSGPKLRIETDAGLRTVEVVRRGGKVVHARTSMGRPEQLERIPIEVGLEVFDATRLKLGNQHCVLFGDENLLERSTSLGRGVEEHVIFPDRTNVEFVTQGPNGLIVRFWERGVGVTASCGTGACACAVAAIIRGLVTTPVDVQTTGGVLRVSWDGAGEVFLSGPIE